MDHGIVVSWLLETLAEGIGRGNGSGARTNQRFWRSSVLTTTGAWRIIRNARRDKNKTMSLMYCNAHICGAVVSKFFELSPVEQ